MLYLWKIARTDNNVKNINNGNSNYIPADKRSYPKKLIISGLGTHLRETTSFYVGYPDIYGINTNEYGINDSSKENNTAAI